MPTFLENTVHFPQWRTYGPTEIIEAQVVQERKNKNLHFGSIYLKKKKNKQKDLFLSPCWIVESNT